MARFPQRLATGLRQRWATGLRRAVVAGLLLALLHLSSVAPALAAGPASSRGPEGLPARSSTEAGAPPAPTASAKSPRGDGPRNPYDMEALRQFDAGSHRAEEPN